MTATLPRVWSRALPQAPARSSWLITGANLDPHFGGISSVVGSLCSAVSASGSFDMALAQFGLPETQPLTGPNHTTSLYPLADTPWLTSRRHWQALSAAVNSADGVHIHGVWQKHCAVTSFLARRQRRPYMVSAHGMLDGWALGQKRWKKALYSALVESPNLQGASCLHALTRAEAQDYRRITRNIPVALVPNGVHIHDASPEAFLHRFPALRDRSLMLFLGRLHQKKGIDLLIRAWQQIQPRFKDAHLVLAGPDCEGTRLGLEEMAAELGLSSHVTFTGMLEGALKWSALASAQVFVLPSHSEGLSVSTLEALGSGTPVVITPQCHLPEVAQVGAGWTVDPEVAALAPALTEALSLTSTARAQMGQRGIELVARRFSWPVVGAQMAEVYQWIVGGPQPTTVEFL